MYGRRRRYKKSYTRRVSRSGYVSKGRTRVQRTRRHKNSRIGKKWPVPIHQTAIEKFTYLDDLFTTSVTAGGSALRVFRGNSLFDPDATGVGVQPYCYDQLVSPTALYQYYNAYASKITVYFSTAAAVKHLRVFLVPNRSDSPAYQDPSDLTMVPHARQTVYDAQDGSKGRVSAYCSTSKMYPEKTSRDSDFVGVYNGNPGATGVWYWLLYFWSDDGVPSDITYDVRIDYYARLSRQNIMNES